jgi:hypothetical protein
VSDIRADAPHAVVPSRRVPSGARRSCSNTRTWGSGAADLSAGRVVLHKPTGDAWRGIGRGVKSRFVKPSSKRSMRPRAKSVGSSGGVERRRVESTSSEVLLGGGVLVRDKASTLTGRRWKRAWPKRRKGARKGYPDDAEATGRQRFGWKRVDRVEKARRSRPARRSGAFRRERNARPVS